MSKIKLKRVEITFPNLWQTATFGGEDTGKYDATFLIDKSDEKTVNHLKRAISAIIKEKFKGKNPGADRICLRDGDELDKDYTVGKYVIKANNKRRPLIVDKDRSPIIEDDDKCVGGDIVNAIIDFWAQDNQFGKRINANLLGVQFVKEGERHQATKTANPDDFDAEIDDDDDDDGDIEDFLV